MRTDIRNFKLIRAGADFVCLRGYALSYEFVPNGFRLWWIFRSLHYASIAAIDLHPHIYTCIWRIPGYFEYAVTLRIFFFFFFLFKYVIDDHKNITYQFFFF